MIANEFMEAEINKEDVPYNEKKLVDRYFWYSLNALVSVGFFLYKKRAKMNYYEDIQFPLWFKSSLCRGMFPEQERVTEAETGNLEKLTRLFFYHRFKGVKAYSEHYFER